MKKLTALAMTMIMAVSLFTGCGSFESSTGDNEQVTNNSTEEKVLADTFTWIGEKLIGMNPLKSNSTNDGNFYYLTMASLVRTTQDGVVPDLAENWDISEDGLTYTFHLRDSKWHDGVEVTANDFVYAFKLYCTAENGYNGSGSFMIVQGVEDYYNGTGEWEDVAIKAEDEKTLVVSVNKSSDDLIGTWAYDPQYPIREDLHQQYGEQYGTAPEKTGFCGPYKCVEWMLDSKYVLEKVDTYWDHEENWPMKKIEALEVSDANTAIAMLENGEVDALYSVKSDYISAIEEIANVKTFVSNGLQPIYMNTNGTSEEAGKVLSNKNFRKALSYAIDREAIAKAVNVLNVGTSRATLELYKDEDGNLVTEKYPIECAPINGNKEMAQDYLAKALDELGYNDVSDLPKLTYMSYENDSNKLVGETIIDTWKQVLGITCVEYVQYPINTAIGNFYQNAYDFFMISTGTGGFAYSNTTQYKTGGDMNMGFWKNDEFNALVAQLEQSNDVAERYELLQQAEQILIDDAAYCPLFATGHATAAQKYVENYSVAEFGTGYYFQQLKVYK